MISRLYDTALRFGVISKQDIANIKKGGDNIKVLQKIKNSEEKKPLLITKNKNIFSYINIALAALSGHRKLSNDELKYLKDSTGGYCIYDPLLYFTTCEPSSLKLLDNRKLVIVIAADPSHTELLRSPNAILESEWLGLGTKKTN